MRLLLCVALAAACLAPVALADPFDRMLPDSTVIYISVENIQRTKERWEKSALFGLWNDAAVQAFLEKPLQKWTDEMKKLKETEGFTVEEVLEVLAGQVAVAVPEVTFDARGDLRAHPVMLADIGENERQVKELVARMEEVQLKDENVRRMEEEFGGLTIVNYARADLEEGAPPPSGPNCWCIAQKTLMVAERLEDLKLLIARRGEADQPSLARHEAYRRVRARLGESPEAVAYLNVRAMAKAMAESRENDQEMQMVATILGLDSIEALGAQARLGRGGVTFNLFVSVPDHKEGLLKLFDSPNSPLTPPRWVPPDTSGAMTLAVDFAGLLTEARRLEAKLGQQGSIDMFLEMAKGMGVDVEKDIIGALGKEITFYSKLPEPGAARNPMMRLPPVVVAIEIKDKPRLEGALDKLVAVAQGWGLAVEEEDYLGTKVRKMAVVVFQVGMTILPDQFLISLQPDLLKEVIRRYGKDVKGVVDAEDFARGMARLPQGRMLVGFERFAKSFRTGLLAGLMSASIDEKLVPKTEVIEKYIDVASSAMVNEEGGLLYTYILAFKQEEAEK